MKVIIPMSGTGSRFIKAGFTKHKSLLDVLDLPIIKHVIDLFDDSFEFIFICSKDLVENSNVVNILRKFCKNCEIVIIDPHKLGPVFAVTKAFSFINDEEQVIVNYCDFNCLFDIREFLYYVKRNQLDGCIPAYKGFHPHCLGSTNYAYLKEINGEVVEVKEKEPFTENRMDEYASTGTYYFSRGEYIKKYFKKLIHENININGEFYCSLVYNLMIKDGLKVKSFNIEKFMQWGTPQDFNEFKIWCNYFLESKLQNTNSKINCVNLLPMAGFGKRFVNTGFNTPKPFLKVRNSPLFINAITCLPKAKQDFISTRKALIPELENYIKSNSISANLIDIGGPTDGQAITVLNSLSELPDLPINITACDHFLKYKIEEYEKLMSNNQIDIVVWGFTNHQPAIRNPNMYGWIESDNQNNIKNISVKKPISEDLKENIVTGTFTFKSKEILEKAINFQIQSKDIINNEYYLDSTINSAIKLGYKVKLFQVDYFICLGTPEEYNTFLYWEDTFDKWEKHPFTKYIN